MDRTNLADRRDVDSRVYDAAEDSALLAAVVQDTVDSEDLVLDVGTGSGFIAAKLQSACRCVVGIDINPHACRVAHGNGVEVVLGDLVSPIQAGVFDVVSFNPPYLPGREHAWDDWFEVATTAGETGREIIERFLDGVGRVLQPGGEVFIVVSSLTGVEEVVTYAGECGFSSVAVRDDQYAGETLTVLKFV